MPCSQNVFIYVLTAIIVHLRIMPCSQQILLTILNNSPSPKTIRNNFIRQDRLINFHGAETTVVFCLFLRETLIVNVFLDGFGKLRIFISLFQLFCKDFIVLFLKCPLTVFDVVCNSSRATEVFHWTHVLPCNTILFPKHFQDLILFAIRSLLKKFKVLAFYPLFIIKDPFFTEFVNEVQLFYKSWIPFHSTKRVSLRDLISFIFLSSQSFPNKNFIPKTLKA